MKKTKVIVFILMFIILINVKVFANNATVYIDKENIDTKYHSIICDLITPNRYKAISVEDAFDSGYRRCPSCSPAMSDTEYNERYKHAQELTKSINPPISSSKNSTSSNNTTSSFFSSKLLGEMLAAGFVAFIFGIIELFRNKDKYKVKF